MTTATTAPTVQTIITTEAELDTLRKIAAGGQLGATLDTYEELRAATRLVREGLAVLRDALGIGVATYVITPAGRQRLAEATSPKATVMRHWRLARIVLENLAYDGATGHLYDLRARPDKVRATIQALLDGGYIVRRGALRRRGVNPERYAITDDGRQLLAELRRIRPATPRPVPRRTITVGNCKVEIYDMSGYVGPHYHVTIYIRHAGIWYAAGASSDFSQLRAFRDARRYLYYHRYTEALEEVHPAVFPILASIARGFHNDVDIRLVTPFKPVKNVRFWLEDLVYTHVVETAPKWFEIAPVMPTRALVPVRPNPRALVPAGHFPPVPKPAPIPPASTPPTESPDPHWRMKLWKTSRVVVRGGRGKYYFIVYTPDGERHDSRNREDGLRIFYSAERAQKEGEAFEEDWWLKHRWEASQTETLTHRGIEVKLRKLKHARGWWWRVDATVGEGLERTKKDAIAAAKADIADAEVYLRSKGYSI